MKTGLLKLSNYCVYILRCADNTLYSGMTNDINNRLKIHNSRKGAKYTRGRLPVTCVYIESSLTKSEALKREIQLKKLTKLQKEILISKEVNMNISKIIYNDLECLTLQNNEYEIIVSISTGPRILSFTKNKGSNVLCDKGQFSQVVDGENWDIVGGHRLWHSPEAFPRTYFSDTKPVNYVVEDKFVSFSTASDKSGISKEVKISFENNKVKLSHKLTNCGLWPVKLSVWPITILAPNGVAKIALSEIQTGYLPNRNIVFWDYSNVNDSRISYKDNSLMIKQVPNSTSLKIGTNSTVGIGEYHVNGQIFVKEFEPIQDSEYPDMGCNIEIYTCDYMLEMETLSPLKTLSTGESITHDELWSIKL